MAERPTVPVRVRRVSGELRELRHRHGLAADEVARALGMSVSKLSRLENGIRKPFPDDVCALLGLYRVPAPRRDELLSLVRDGEDHNWWRVQEGNLPAMWDELPKFEREATAIKNYELAIVPGLLQTPEYVRAFSSAANEELTADEIEALVEIRAKRQAQWRRPDGPPLHVIFEEGVCRRPVGTPELMYQQLRHIVQVARQSKLTVQVVPSSVGAHPGLDGPFMLLDFRDQSALVYIDNRCSGAFVEEAEYVTATQKSFWRLRQMALTPEDSVDLVASIADEVT